MNTHFAWIPCGAIAVLLWTLLQTQQPATPLAPAVVPTNAVQSPRVGVRFEGYLPGTRDEMLAGEFAVEFKIYLSPQGGDPIWSEAQRVKVVAGRMDVVLGATTPIPMSVHEATFKFVGASVNAAREVYPRFTIVNTVYASSEAALRASPVEAADARTTRAGRGDVYAAPGARIETHSQQPGTWKEALLSR